MPRFALQLTIIIALALNPLQAQDQQPAADPKESAIKALQSLGEGAWRFTGKVTERKPEGGGGMAMFGMAGLGGPGGGKTFKGPVELVRTAEGDLLCASAAAVPGVAVLLHNKEQYKRSTNRVGKSVNVDDLARDVLSALDLPRLLEKAGKAAAWKSGPGKTEGLTRYGARLDTSLVTDSTPKPEGPMAGMALLSQPQVMEVTVALQVDASGRVTNLLLEILRSDPMATMQAFMEESGGMFDPAELEGFEPEEGPRTIYDFTRAEDKPSSRAAGLLKSMRAAAGQ